MSVLTKNVFRKRALALAVSGAAAVTVSSVSAAELEEVVVTSQMRAETLKDVPMSVSAFSGDELKAGNRTDFKELFSITPGISGETQDSFFDSVSVRGVNNNGFGSGSDPAMGLFLDGVYQSRTGANPTMFDMERVEIVKGPQGTLFGRNTASGAIAMVSNKPGDTFAGDITVGAGQFGQKNYALTYDLPATDNLAFRVAAMHESQDGHIKNLAGGRDLGASEVTAARVTSVWAGDATTVTLLTQYEDRLGDGTVYRALDTDGDWDEVFNDTQGKDESEIADVILTIERDLEAATLSSITGYKTHNYSYVEDFDGTGFANDIYTRDQSGEFLSQEFRLTSTDAGPFTWVAGVSWYSEKLDADFQGIANEDSLCDGIFTDEGIIAETAVFETCEALSNNLVAVLPDSGYGSTSEAMDDFFGTDHAGGDVFEYATDKLSVENSLTKGKYTGWGVFGNFGYDLTEKTNLGFGVRYTEDTKDYSVNAEWPESWTGGWNYQGMFTDGPISGEKTWSNVTGRVTLNHDLNDDVTVYASAATGYKSGGFDYLTYLVTDPAFDADPDAWMEEYEWTVDASNAEPNSFDEETVLSYEIGLKSRLLDNRLALNAAAFSYNYEDLQQSFFIGSAAVTRNVGEVDGRGLEVDARWLLTDNLDLFLGAAWLDTEFSGAPADLCEDCDGNTMAFAPEFSGAAALTYTREIRFGELALSSEYSYTGKQYSELENVEEVALDARGVLNLRASVSALDEAWTTGIYVQNALGEEYYHWGYPAALYNLPATMTDPARGRVIGVDVNYRF
ncbi:TonB-dependent receptor [Biformimicrobium ophioploci]|uniref:TonB-dependent receptor n=1 Tax=Biformimicrobium ophioploci TaxID=3036711 RepID=A0ABQ6M1N7_9GAMM|nr:TonB-dependent receptor [Microbulbifer sp. NKW57]GMG88271.1 TonB-dependent receptor [Microbulbifer sp. NKW57]